MVNSPEACFHYGFVRWESGDPRVDQPQTDAFEVFGVTRCKSCLSACGDASDLYITNLDDPRAPTLGRGDLSCMIGCGRIERHDTTLQLLFEHRVEGSFQ